MYKDCYGCGCPQEMHELIAERYVNSTLINFKAKCRRCGSFCNLNSNNEYDDNNILLSKEKEIVNSQ